MNKNVESQNMEHPLEVHACVVDGIKAHFKEVYTQLYTVCGRDVTLFCAYTNVVTCI
jgi:hypothetical protein